MSTESEEGEGGAPVELAERSAPDWRRLGDPRDEVRVGQWFTRDGEDLCCVTRVGSNYAMTEGPRCASERVHLDEFALRCAPEPQAQAIISGLVEQSEARVRELMDRAQALMASLSVGARPGLTGPDTQAISVLSGRGDPGDYKSALEEAKAHTLPGIFREIRLEHGRMERLMESALLPMQGELRAMESSIGAIEDRIFHLDLYAGLSEEVELVRAGAPAGYHEKIHVMQRRLYMDEESLLDYEAGGMEFRDIQAFDAWLAKPKNTGRVLPHPRCLVAFRVRRAAKERAPGEDVSGMLWAFVKTRLERQDELTFLYFRNGDRLYRMSTRMEFPERLFGDRGFEVTERMWARMSGSLVRQVITHREYTSKLKEIEANLAAMARLRELHPDVHYFGCKEAPDHARRAYRRLELSTHESFEREHEEFTPRSVYFDEIKAHLGERARETNRIAVILQGLLDRSDVFAPHPPAELWTAEGFGAAVELVHDASRALDPGEEPPDFEAYRAACNASIEEGSVVMGQQKHWVRHMVERFDRDERRAWRGHMSDDMKIPRGNPGPGRVARVERFHPRARRCRFTWLRKKARWPHEKTPASFTIEADRLFNLDAYAPGDYLKFFADHRTRARYLKWAPLLLTAEDYHAGKVEVREPGA